MDRPLHCRRTLDQYRYPSLRNTTVRDGDQILWKRRRGQEEAVPFVRSTSKLKPRNPSPPPRQPPQPKAEDSSSSVLMVDQLWLWIIDKETVITFFSPRERDDHEGYSREANIRSLIYQDINGDYANQCDDPFDFAALAISHAVKGLLANTSDENLQVFRIFEEYISILTEKQTSSFKDFRDNHRFSKEKDIELEKHIDNREDLNALLELRDIEDELNTIDKLFKEQQTCVGHMLVQFQDLYQRQFKGSIGISLLHGVNHFLFEHQEQIDGMLKSAEAAKKAYKELLDMKQKQASIIEAQQARRQTKVAANQSRTVVIFTLVTIIFLPLSFFASVFGINAREWSGTQTNPSLREIFTYMTVVSLVVILVALLAAFGRLAQRLAQKMLGWAASQVLKLWMRKSAADAKPSAPYDDTPDLERAATTADWERSTKKFSTIARAQSRLDKEKALWGYLYDRNLME